jgi:hypothetical protein
VWRNLRSDFGVELGRRPFPDASMRRQEFSMRDKAKAQEDETEAQGRLRRSASDPDREVRALMRKTGTSYSQVLALIHRYGNDRVSIERAAAKLRTT